MSAVDRSLDLFGLDRNEAEWFEVVRQAECHDALGQLGQYELLAEIGRGGQGMVYQARQPGTKRLVAIKHLWAGSFATASSRARFEREIEAASALSHPNIVRVYGTDVINSQQVLTMEWIDGVPIDQWAVGKRPPISSQNSDSAEQPPSEPHEIASARPRSLIPSDVPPRRTVQNRLSVFALVCDAVSHAHQRGVLHRDLKPSNILVDQNDQPHVLDFGLAKFTRPDGQCGDMRSLTHGSGFLGTPAYASPEQVTGDQRDVDVRSDVYALGVILYQMLTGELPYGVTRSLADVFDAIRSSDPKHPSSLRRELNDEIDAIVLKALEKQPPRRYQSVDAMAADVRRYLNNETVLAHAPSAGYQARKFIARHRTVVFAGAGIVAALAIGLLTTALALHRVVSAQTETAQARRSAEQVNAFLNQTLASADPTVMRGSDLTVSAMLQQAVHELDGGALAEQPLAEARVRLTIGEAYESLGLYAAAAPQFQAALNLRRKSLGDRHLDVAEALSKLATVLVTEEDFAAAERCINEEIEIRRQAVGESHLLFIQALEDQGNLWMMQGNYEQANPMLCAALPRAIRLTGGDQNDTVAHLKLMLAFVGACTNKFEDRVRMFAEVVDTERALHGDFHDHLARALINLGATHHSTGNLPEAEKAMTAALEIRRRLYGVDHPLYANALFNLASIYRTTGRIDQAEEAYRQVLTIDERRLPAGHFHTARTRLRLGSLLTSAGRFDQAEPVLRQAIAELEDGSLRRASYAATAHRVLGECLLGVKRFDEAEQQLLKSFNDTKPNPQNMLYDTTKDRLTAAACLVRLYTEWNKPEQAGEWKKAQMESRDPAASAPAHE